jgi:tetratricopeptide (TPR) repeat protein/predicted Ser/Thr protein kinase
VNSTDKTVAAPRLPRSIGRYQITGRLGKGAMGVVYSAHDAMMERTVAIKVMMADLEDDPETSSRFYREARSAGQLVHPNIITIFDMGQENGRPYIVMEFLDGETLNKYLARPETADVEIKIELMIQICQGLHAAHSHGIFHRDVKPGNLLVRPSGELKIVDFGIARLASSSMTASGLIMGTPDYMSPEQARGQDIDQRSDIFSAGAVFYFILTGRKPFAAPDLAAVLLKVQTEEPLPIRDHEAPPTLARIVMKALAKNPVDRYQTCGRMVAELEHFKRNLESESLQHLTDAGRRLAELEPLAAERRSLIAKLGIQPAPPEIDAARLALVDRHAAIVEPLRRTVVTDLLGAVRALEEPTAAEVAKWRSAAQSFEEGMQTLAAGRTRDAIVRLEEALRVEPAAGRVSAEVDRCRSMAAEQRSMSDRAAALLDEARKAAAGRQWQVVIGFCDDALELNPAATEAISLREKARASIVEEGKQRKQEAERALVRADAHRLQGRFSDAAMEIARAREADPSGADADAAEAKLNASIAEVERNAELRRLAAEAVAAARRQFAAGQRDEAIAALQAFHTATPEASAAAEISQMQAEVRRIALAERRAAEAAALAADAERALKAGDPQRALDLGTRALAIDPAHVLARKVSGLAGGELKQRAEAQARAAAAARNLEEARQQLARGKFQKARALVSAAADLDPQNPQHKALLARIQEEETLAAAEAERQRIVKQRAKAVAPILERARAAEAQGDMERAVWMAENALALDLECSEAREILQRAQARIAANPKLADETVDLPGETGQGFDPDDTASLTRPTGLWDRLASAFRSWKSPDAAPPEPPDGRRSDSKGRAT